VNDGIIKPTRQLAAIPQGLLGNPTPIPMPDQAWHPEAADWRVRVFKNGGSVSDVTTRAVSNFCTAIDAAGLRGSMYRLNLLAGNNLLACLVPLYRAPSPTVTQLGGTTDTNNNFVSADFQEMGPGGGLAGGGTKFLNPTFATNLLPSFYNSHLSFSATRMEAAGVGANYIGSYGGSAAAALAFQAGGAGRFCYIGNFSVVVNFKSSPTEPHILGCRTSSTLFTGYRSGASIGFDTTSAGDTRTTAQITVFGGGSVGSPYTTSIFRMYSFGLSFTATQAADFATAVIAFNTAMGRA
jgi:hypothetical protein